MDKKTFYIKYIEDYCNQFFDTKNLPAGITLALELLDTIDPLKIGIAAESVGDLSITYKENEMPQSIATLLAPYVRPHLVGDKRKRDYNDGRYR